MSRFQLFVHAHKDIFFYSVLRRNLRGMRSVLDVGCGATSPLASVKKTFYSEGVDAFKKSIVQSKKSHIHDRYRLGDIRELEKWYKPKTFDAVIAIDVIEHLPKRDAKKLIGSMEAIAKKKVILLTPNGYYHQDVYENNPYQVHKSGWSADDIRSLGYAVYGLRGLKYLRGEYATIQWKPWLLWGLFSFFSEPLLFLFPSLSYDLFSIKYIK